MSNLLREENITSSSPVFPFNYSVMQGQGTSSLLSNRQKYLVVTEHWMSEENQCISFLIVKKNNWTKYWDQLDNFRFILNSDNEI